MLCCGRSAFTCFLYCAKVVNTISGKGLLTNVYISGRGVTDVCFYFTMIDALMRGGQFVLWADTYVIVFICMMFGFFIIYGWFIDGCLYEFSWSPYWRGFILQVEALLTKMSILQVDVVLTGWSNFRLKSIFQVEVLLVGFHISGGYVLDGFIYFS